jgi:hypothetical protein
VLKGTYLLSRGILEVYLEARADARHTAEYNLDLSEKRGEAVRLAIASRLPGLPGCRLVNLPFGKGGALPSPRGSDYDRRVEVLALWRPYTGAENKAWAKIRSDIFRHYYPHYHKWKGKGLEYLIEQWEVFMGMNQPIRLNPADFDKVRKLVRDYSPELTDDKLQTEEQLTTAFYVIYNKAYREAYEVFEMVFLSYRSSHRSTPYEEAVSIVASGKQR